MCRDRDRTTAYISGAAHPQVIETVKTYCAGYGIKVVVIAVANGVLDAAALEKLLAADENAACFYLQQPNFFGMIENAKAIGEIVHHAGAQYVIGCNPISLGALMSPGACGADIAVGEGQPLGLPLSFGGPYLGFMACKTHLMRKLPGRIVGETTDHAGNRAFVLTLQAREQHIRREKASSNVCSNEALCALTAAVYLSVMGQEGFQEVAKQCHSKAVYAAKQISSVPGFSLLYKGDFFHEFVTSCPDAAAALSALEAKGILGGLPLSDTSILWAVTELNTKAEIDEVAEVLRGAG
jgi:glycine dehydrogenase subunit 1